MKKVLVIDDEKPTRDFIKRLIDSYHFGIEVFTDGENVATGVEAIHRLQPDLVTHCHNTQFRKTQVIVFSHAQGWESWDMQRTSYPWTESLRGFHST